MKRSTLLVTLLVLAGSTATAGFAAQNPPRIRSAAPTAMRGVGCQTDSFGAMRCADGASLPGGAFGVTPHGSPRVPGTAPTAAARPDPIAMIHGDVAADGNLYGDPTATPRGLDGYGCRVGPDGALLCH